MWLGAPASSQKGSLRRSVALYSVTSHTVPCVDLRVFMIFMLWISQKDIVFEENSISSLKRNKNETKILNESYDHAKSLVNYRNFRDFPLRFSVICITPWGRSGGGGFRPKCSGWLKITENDRETSGKRSVTLGWKYLTKTRANRPSKSIGGIFSFFSQFSNEQIGFVIGSTIQAFGQVTAAGFLINQEVGEYATIIKMLRIIMLGPCLITLVLLTSNQSRNNKTNMFYIPYFIIGFIFISVLTSFSFIPTSIILFFQKTSKILLVIAMAGIGLKISIKSVLTFGKKSLLVSIIGYSLQIFFVISMIVLFF